MHTWIAQFFCVSPVFVILVTVVLRHPFLTRIFCWMQWGFLGAAGFRGGREAERSNKDLSSWGSQLPQFDFQIQTAPGFLHLLLITGTRGFLLSPELLDVKLHLGCFCGFFEAWKSTAVFWEGLREHFIILTA